MKLNNYNQKYNYLSTTFKNINSKQQMIGGSLFFGKFLYLNQSFFLKPNLNVIKLHIPIEIYHYS
ncbi:hypothetical protein BHC43_04640 [Snodgrassella alvi]|nr:hypothetical protein BHC43_04640 [Snodgrassella alvi]